jgi:hypothetical protein
VPGSLRAIVSPIWRDSFAFRLAYFLERLPSWLFPSRQVGSAAGLANHGLTLPLQVSDTKHSVRQGATDPRQGNKSHLL